MTVVVLGQRPIRPARHDDEDECPLLPWLGHPDDARTFPGAFVEYPHAAEVRIELDAGVQVGNMQGEMG